MGDAVRVLVTGSRNWPDDHTVEQALTTVLTEADPVDDFIVVHGACPTGADLYASRWARMPAKPGMGVREERHPAMWNIHGKAAGPMRNRHMVSLGADLCLAFILNDSRGTTDCAERARKAGIPVREFRRYAE